MEKTDYKIIKETKKELENIQFNKFTIVQFNSDKSHENTCMAFLPYQ